MAVGPEKRIVATHNLVGSWGKACGRGQPVIVGAHLDPQGNHADGASGVAAMLEAMRLIQANGALEARSCFVFAVFTGDDGGIAGSSRFAAALKERKIRPKAMINVDRAGNLEGNRLLVFGSDSSKEWQPLLNKACEDEKLQCDTAGEGYRPSDHMAFYPAGVPVLDFVTGPPGERINATGGVQVSRVVAAVAIQTASYRQRLRYQKTDTLPALQASSTQGAGARPGAYLGVIPDYAALSRTQGEGAEAESGVRLANVHPKSPASSAGVQGGDILNGIEMPPGADGKRTLRKLRTVEDYMGVLQALKPGDSVVLHLRRGAQDLSVPIEVGKRES
jgi:hypothetical protein